MDIRNWPLDRIMQLPDCCFGRRWPLVVGGLAYAGAGHMGFSKMALPEWCVIWEVRFWCRTRMDPVSPVEAYAHIHLTDKEIVAWAELSRTEELFKHCGSFSAGNYNIGLGFELTNLKFPVNSQGRHICVYMLNATEVNLTFYTSFVISSMPTEVPDCLLSALGKSP